MQHALEGRRHAREKQAEERAAAEDEARMRRERKHQEFLQNEQEAQQREADLQAARERALEIEALEEEQNADAARKLKAVRKQQEWERYVDAMRAQLNDHMKRTGLGIVPLCDCFGQATGSGALFEWFIFVLQIQ